MTAAAGSNVRTDVSSDGLVAASVANFVDGRLLMAAAGGAELLPGHGIRAYSTGLDFLLLNGVVETRLAPHDADQRIREIIDLFGARAVPFVWWVLPGDEPADLPQRLEAAGLVTVGGWPAMATDLAALPGPPLLEDLEIHRVGDERDLERHFDVVEMVMGLPPVFLDALGAAVRHVGFGPEAPIQTYVGMLDGRAVAASALILAGGAAGIYNVATIEELRGRGIGAALTLTPLHEARERGYRIGTLQSSPMGYSVYERLGFQECARFTPYRA